MAVIKSHNGGDVRVFINGRAYTPVTAIRWTASSSRHEINGIDQSIPFELVTGVCSVNGSLEILRIRDAGGIQGPGIAAPERLILQERYFSLTVIDRISDTVLLQINEASVTDENWQAGRGQVSGSVGFKGIAWQNDVDL